MAAGRTRPGRPGDVDWAPPVDDQVATRAMQYLIDGYSPSDVAERLGVSRAWCQRMKDRLSGRSEQQ